MPVPKLSQLSQLSQSCPKGAENRHSRGSVAKVSPPAVRHLGAVTVGSAPAARKTAISTNPVSLKNGVWGGRSSPTAQRAYGDARAVNPIGGGLNKVRATKRRNSATNGNHYAA